MAEGMLEKAIKGNGFVLTAECVPPRGYELNGFKGCASTLAGAVNAIYAPESEDGVRLSSSAACSHIAAAGGDPILALLTRDMNRIALQSTILGAASMGVKNVFCTTGRHQALTTSGSARGVFDLDAVQLLQVADGIRKDGKLADGSTLESKPELILGIDTNPFSDPVELQVLVLQKAVAAGADFVITQPVFNLDRFNVWMSHVRERGLDKNVCVIAGVMPLTSSKQAVALAQKYNHLDIRDEDVNRLDSAQDQKAAGVHLAAETIAYVQKVEGVRGVHLMCGDDAALAQEVIKASGVSRS